MNKKNTRISIAVSIVILVSVFFLNRPTKNNDNILVQVKKGEFIVDVITTGELEAKHSVEIQGPIGLRAHRIWQVTIQDMIDEGTYVKKGDYVARLDASELTNKLSVKTTIKKNFNFIPILFLLIFYFSNIYVF